MASETGTALNPNDFLDKLRVFLLAQGWISDSWILEGANRRLHLHKGATYLNAKASNDSSNIWQDATWFRACLGVSLGTAYSGATGWNDQAGVPRNASNQGIGACCPLPTGAIVGYAFYYDPTYESLIAYVEVASGIWRWFGFGADLIKAGTWTGGPWVAGCSSHTDAGVEGYAGHGVTLSTVYLFGANRDSYQPQSLVFVRADVDAFTGKWVCCAPGGTTGKLGDTSFAGGAAVSNNVPWGDKLIDRTRNALNSLSVLLPVQVFADRDAGGKSLLGTLPNVFGSNITGLVVGQAYTLGPSDYVPYPADTSARGTVVRKV